MAVAEGKALLTSRISTRDNSAMSKWLPSPDRYSPIRFGLTQQNWDEVRDIYKPERFSYSEWVRQQSTRVLNMLSETTRKDWIRTALIKNELKHREKEAD